MITFPRDKADAPVPSISGASSSRRFAGTCEAGWRAIIARLALFFHAAADFCQDLRRRRSNRYPRHSKASVVMIDHHTGKFGNAKTEFGIA